jgi:hypothetical protein
MIGYAMTKPKTYSYLGSGGIKFGGGARAENKRRPPGRKKPSYESVSGFERSNSGVLVEKRRIIDREKNRYFEKVVEHKSRKVLRRIEEPLTNHTGRGSAKARDKKKGR